MQGPTVFPATLFDYNGVLVDDEHVHLAAFREALAPLGIELSERDYWERYLGYDDAAGFRAMLEDAGREAPADAVARLVEQKRPLYLARARVSLVAFPGARQAVERRAALGPVGVVSGALRDEIELGLSVLGVRERVAFIVSAEDTQACKPDPEGYEIGKAKLLGCVPRQTALRALVIEDSVAGIQAAKAAGLACVAVAHSYAAEVLEQAGADAVLPTIAELTEEVLVELYRKLHG
ncbi:MAG TPA: HAD family phosphatase [Polyangiaceae bacterium]|nr:HAD family phosphatase [Polyangiaceae bacterium]